MTKTHEKLLIAALAGLIIAATAALVVAPVLADGAAQSAPVWSVSQLPQS